MEKVFDKRVPACEIEILWILLGLGRERFFGMDVWNGGGNVRFSDRTGWWWED